MFRVGEFYETFNEDAITAARVLGITLKETASPEIKGCAGFPFHALDSYLRKLVKAGYRVAVCDQLKDPKKTDKNVRRGVTHFFGKERAKDI